MDILNEIYTFAKDHDVVIDITFNRTDGIRIDMKMCPYDLVWLVNYYQICFTIYLSEQELKYNKVDICTVLNMMLKELKKTEEEENNEL